MPVIRIILAALIVSLAPPVPIVLRFLLRSSGANAADVQRVEGAIRRGFYSDSTVIPPAETLDVGRAAAVPYDLPNARVRRSAATSSRNASWNPVNR